MALGSQMDDTIDVLLLHELVEGVEVANVHLHKLIVWLVLDVLQVGEIAGIGQFVEVDDVILRIFVHEKAHYVTSYEACAAGDDNCTFHVYGIYFFFDISVSKLLAGTYCNNFTISHFIAFDGQSYQSSFLMPALHACCTRVDM